MLEHSEEDWILLQPPFSVCSRHFLGSLCNDIVSQTFGELLYAIFDNAEASSLPRLVLWTCLETECSHVAADYCLDVLKMNEKSIKSCAKDESRQTSPL